MKVDSETVSAKGSLSRRAVWVPLTAGVAFWMALSARAPLFMTWRQGTQLQGHNHSFRGPLEAAQAQEAGGEAPEVPPDQVEKYINAYKAMQRNHSLTVDEAASQQGLSVKQFRDIEGKIERDDMLREHVRQVLGKSSNPSAQ
jgi:hypothetical protein